MRIHQEDTRRIRSLFEQARQHLVSQGRFPGAAAAGKDGVGIRVDAEFGKSMIYVTNEDKPGFIGRFAGLLGDARLNIATFHLGRNAPGGDAIALVEVDGAVPAEGLAKTLTLPHVKQAKALPSSD